MFNTQLNKPCFTCIPMWIIWPDVSYHTVVVQLWQSLNTSFRHLGLHHKKSVYCMRESLWKWSKMTVTWMWKYVILKWFWWGILRTVLPFCQLITHFSKMCFFVKHSKDEIWKIIRSIILSGYLEVLLISKYSDSNLESLQGYFWICGLLRLERVKKFEVKFV